MEVLYSDKIMEREEKQRALETSLGKETQGLDSLTCLMFIFCFMNWQTAEDIQNRE